MTDLKCKNCGTKVGEGSIEDVEVKDGRVKKLFIKGYLKGELHRNHSNNPENWTYLCPSCQRNKV